MVILLLKLDTPTLGKEDILNTMQRFSEAVMHAQLKELFQQFLSYMAAH